VSSALPILNQAGKPAGVAGKSRDDFDAWTGANPIVCSDGGVGASTWLWQIVDQPPGAAAVLSTPNAASTNLTNATVEGSYLLQLTVDGGGVPGQTYRIIAAVQMALPVWVSPGTAARLRIPAFGETLQFNVQSSPGAGANLRGWAEEMSQWFRALATYAFGVRIQNAGVAVGSAPFYTLNFVGASGVVDAGNGVVNVTVGGGLVFLNEGASIGTPITDVDARIPRIAVATGVLLADQNAQFIRVGSVARLHVTAAHHVRHHHSPGISRDGRPAVAGTVSLAPTLDNLVPDWEFGPILANQTVVSEGRTLTNADVGANLPFALPGATAWALYDLVLQGAAAIAVQARTLASCAAPTSQIVLIDISDNHPTGVFALETQADAVRWGGGPYVSTPLSGVFRLYHASGVHWVDVFVATAPVGSTTSNWTVPASYGDTERRVGLVRTCYWNPGDGYIFGLGPTVDGSTYRRLLPSGSVGARDLQESALARIDRVGGDFHLSGVVFDHRQSTSGAEPSGGGFDLITGSGENFPRLGLGMHGGDFWLNGRRYTYEAATTFDGFLPADSTVMIYAAVNQQQGTTYVSFTVDIIDPVEAVRDLMRGQGGMMGATLGRVTIVPLYFGTTDLDGNLNVEGRIDLRRDVAHLGEWTAGSRSQQTALTNPDHILLPADEPEGGRDEAVFRAEFESIGAALVYYAALEYTEAGEGSDNIHLQGSGRDDAPLHIRVVRSTRETFPFVLWRNVTLEGVGQPTVFVEARNDDNGWVYIGYDALAEGADGNRLVYNVRVSGIDWVLASLPPGGAVPARARGGLLAIRAPSVDLTDITFATEVPAASCDGVVVENCGFGSLFSAAAPDDLWAAIHVDSVVGDGVNLLAGQVQNLILRNNRIVPFHRSATGETAMSLFNTGIVIGVRAPSATDSKNSNRLQILDNLIHTPLTGISLIGLDAQVFAEQVEIAGNEIEIVKDGGIFAVGLNLMVSLQNSWIENNQIVSDDDAVYVGYDQQRSWIQHNALTGDIALHLDTINADELVIAHNRMVGGTCIDPSFSRLILCVIADNLLQGSVSRGSGDTQGVYYNGVGAISELCIERNTVWNCTTGLLIKLPVGANRVRIADNVIKGILGATAGTAAQIGHGRGIAVVLTEDERDRGLVISGNVITDYARRGTADTPLYGALDTISAGITVSLAANTASTYARGVAILNNVIMPASGNDLALTKRRMTLATVGIAVLGDFDLLTIKGNKIANDRVSCEALTAGIFVDSKATLASVSCPQRLVEGNDIAWVSGCVLYTGVDEQKENAAGILLRGAGRRFSVVRNTVTIQSITDQAGITGYIHGILFHHNGSPDTPVGLRVDDNVVATGKVFVNAADFDATANGCGINVHGVNDAITPADISVSGNTVLGDFCFNDDATSFGHDLESYAGIAFFHTKDYGGVDFRIDNNLVQMAASVVNATPRLHQGIRVGSSNHGAVPSAIRRISVSNNRINLATDTSKASARATWSAALVLVSSLNTPDPAGCSFAKVVGNLVRRDDLNATPATKGIWNYGFGESLFADNVVIPATGASQEIADTNLGGAMPAQNIWTNNRFGSVAEVGVHGLAAPPYQVVGTGTNWTGTAFV
jgi:hypothetical protein